MTAKPVYPAHPLADHLADLLLLLLLSLCFLSISGCGQSALIPYQKHAELQFSVDQGGKFFHQVVYKRSSANDRQAVLHVYIEGDGRPWWTRYEVADDPTPRELPMLDLMQMDNANAIYLGRPCYFALKDPACESRWWTDSRYSRDVVSSLSDLLDLYAKDFQAIRLFGHSGGGALAMLLAAERDDIETVVTLAANLDINAWTAHHGYSPLTDSKNPVDYPLAKHIKQIHIAAAEDKAVPAWLVKQSAEQLGASDVRIIQDIDHNCCWNRHWPEILRSIE